MTEIKDMAARLIMELLDEYDDYVINQLGREHFSLQGFFEWLKERCS